MKLKIKRTKFSYLHLNGKDYPVDVDLEVPFDEAFRVSREPTVDAKLDYEKVPYDTTLWQNRKFINLITQIDMTSGWGNVAVGLIKSSKELDIAVAGTALNVPEISVSRAIHMGLKQEGAAVWHEQPRESWLDTPFERNIGLIPWETTRIPASWVGRINRFNALLVPCKQNIDAFRDSGVNIPIELVHWGIDPTRYYPVKRPRSNDTFTFGTMGALSTRKGTDMLVRAFQAEFRGDEKVRMICKTSNYQYPFWAKDKRIIEQLGPVSDEELRRDFFVPVDCFVFPTRGEGFGMTPLEAMATGLPVIATGWSGITEYLTENVGWTLKYRLVPATDFATKVYKEDCGEWAEPDQQHLQELMRYAYEHQDEVREKGAAAAEYVQREWTWEKQIPLFTEALSKHL